MRVSIKSLRFIHAYLIPFLFLKSIQLYWYTTFVSLIADQYWNHFHFLVIMSNTIVIINVHFFWHGYVFIFPYYKLLSFILLVFCNYLVWGLCSWKWEKENKTSIHYIKVKNLKRSYLVQLLSCVWLFAIPWTAACQASLSITSSQSSPKLKSIELVMPSNHLILCPLLLLPPSIFPSIRVFSNESVLCNRWPKYWSFSLSMSPSSEYSGLISFGMDCLDLLAVQGTLKSLLQHHSSILWCSVFFIVQLSHPYMTTGKTIALTRRTFFGKVI